MKLYEKKLDLLNENVNVDIFHCIQNFVKKTNNRMPAKRIGIIIANSITNAIIDIESVTPENTVEIETAIKNKMYTKAALR